MDDEIIDAHGYEVDADRIMPAGVEGDSQFCSDPVGRRDQYRVAKTGGFKIEKPTETTQCRIRAGTGSLPRQRFYGFDKSVPRVDIDTGVTVRKTVICCFLRYGFLMGLRGIQRAQKILYPGGFAMLLHRVHCVSKALRWRHAGQGICVDA